MASMALRYRFENTRSRRIGSQSTVRSSGSIATSKVMLLGSTSACLAVSMRRPTGAGSRRTGSPRAKPSTLPMTLCALRSSALAPGEAEHAPDDVGRLADLGAHRVEVSQEPSPVIEVALGEEERRLRDREGVAELVRHARTDGAGGGQAARAARELGGIDLGH